MGNNSNYSLYKKNEVTFAIILIVIYVVGTSLAESITESLGVVKLIPAAFHVVYSLILLCWINKNGLKEKYGLILPKYNLKEAWYYIPLLFVALLGLIGGIKIRYTVSETILFIVSMFCVGFLEEIIFRGVLFVGMAQKKLRPAIIVSAITFGIGHIVNLFNGSSIVDTLLQIVFAIAVGFVLVILFYKGKSLIPCVVFHGLNNALSAVEKTDEEVAAMFSISANQYKLLYVSICIVTISVYCIYLVKKDCLKK